MVYLKKSSIFALKIKNDVVMSTFDFHIPAFERFTNDQQFVNVADAITKFETEQGGMTPEEIWEHATNMLNGLKKVSRPEITVKRMFSFIVGELRKQLPDRSRGQIDHTAYCILFCAVYILCANDEKPDPNQDIIDNICQELSKMPDIVPLFEYVEKMEDEQEAKGYTVEPRNVLAKPHVETAAEAAQRILKLLKKDIIEPIVSNKFVQPSYKAEFEQIWKDILANESLLGQMREEEFGATYNLKLVLNILAMMSYNRSVLSASNNKLNATLFPKSNGHPKYFTNEIDGSFSAFNSSSQQAIVQSIIEKHKK
jgi:hypothetical protein